MVGPTEALVSELASIVGADAVKSGVLDRHLYSKDAGVARGDVSVVVLPKTARQVAAIVRTAVAHGIAVVPRGAGTGLTGGAVPEGAAILLVTTRMDQVDVDAANRTAWVGPGVINLDLSNQTA
ncbi:MAG: FAD-binding protein, partial [Acidimicrobiia bacterium]